MTLAPHPLQGSRAWIPTLLAALVLAGAWTVPSPAHARDGEPASLQALVDQARAGDRIAVPTGTYNESVRIGKPLTLEADGPVTVDGGGEPAVAIRADDVSLVNLTLRSRDTPLVARNVSSLTLERMQLEGSKPAQVEGVTWLRVLTLAGLDPPEVAVEDGAVVYGHLVDVRVLDPQSRPYPNRTIAVVDGNRTTVHGTTDANGTLPRIPVADRYEVRGENGTLQKQGGNVTPLLVDGHRTFDTVREGIGTVTITHDPPSLPVSPWVIALGGLTVSAGAGVGVAFRFHQGFRWWWIKVLAPLYTRLARAELLDHDKRDAIYQHVDENPGIHVRQLQRELELKNGTMFHHLRMLEDQDMVRSVEDGMYRRYYLTGQAPDDAGTPSTAQRVARAIVADPGSTNQQLAEALDVEPSTVHYHVDNLAEEGRVRKERDGRKVRLYPAGDEAPDAAA